MVSASGELIPPGNKIENSNYYYQIKKNEIRLFNKIKSAKTGQTSTINYYYEVSSIAGGKNLELTPVTKVQCK
jgi:hypothetical protein